MKYHIRRYWIYLLVFFIGILSSGIYAWKGKISDEIFLGIVASGITMFISVVSFYQTSDQFFKELFTEFNRRYDEMNGFLNSINKDFVVDSPEKRQKIVDYFNLCAEEYMWVKRGRIPYHIWQSWENGIKLHLRRKQINDVFSEERSLWKSSYYGFFDDRLEFLQNRSD